MKSFGILVVMSLLAAGARAQSLSEKSIQDLSQKAKSAQVSAVKVRVVNRTFDFTIDKQGACDSAFRRAYARESASVRVKTECSELRAAAKLRSGHAQFVFVCTPRSQIEITRIEKGEICARAMRDAFASASRRVMNAYATMKCVELESTPAPETTKLQDVMSLSCEAAY